MRLAILLLVGCSAAPAPTTDEGKLRARLGIPPEAQRVIVFQQSAHLDIDWQRTFDDYYDRFVGDIFLEARALLDKQPRAHYSITEMGFLQRHLLYHPEELPALQAHAARGALHIVGGGMTSPDTMLPETEMLFRDYFYGTRFAEDNFGLVPTAAWLPDSFGHAATAPDVLAAAGFTSVGFSRVDGAPTFAEALAGPVPPRPGSSAEMLQQLGSADFMWTGPGGGKIFAHWISAPSLYCQGDNIDYDEQIQLPGGHLGVYDGDQPGFTDDRINEYVAGALSKTPYLFVPVGCDFQHPKEELLGYLDGYNQRQYPKTGVWAVAAPFDDYANLVQMHQSLMQTHQENLPQWTTELSPYFMGFYASRAALKRRVREAARPFWAAEMLAVATGAGEPDPLGLERLTLSDHHDFITGTSKNEVVSGEQLPMLDDAEARGRAALRAMGAALAARLPAASGARIVLFNDSTDEADELVELPWDALPVHGDLPMEPVQVKGAPRLRIAASVPPFGWRAVDLQPGAAAIAPRVSVQIASDTVVLKNEHVQATFTKSGARFALTSLQVDGNEGIFGPSFVVTEYADQGGLWRLGHEMANCHFTANSDSGSDTVKLMEATPLTARVQFVSANGVREARLDAGESGLRLALTAAAAMNTTRTVTFHFDGGGSMRTGLAGGYAERTPERVYSPTFWPAVDWVAMGGWSVLLRQSTGVRFSAGGDVELLAMRWAPSEQCDVEGGMGDDPDVHRIEWMVTAAPSPVNAARAAQRFNRPVEWMAAAGGDGSMPAMGSLASLDGDGVITALKPAERGEGVIVRVLLLDQTATLTTILPHTNITRTDALERDLAPADGLTLDHDTFGAIATLRLH